MTPPWVSIVVPVFNEAALVGPSSEQLLRSFRARRRPFELILAENGSTDDTLAQAHELAARHTEVVAFHVPEANYGRALREGIARARGELVVCEEIDLCDEDFHARALALLERGEAELVIGSKLAHDSRDERPLVRHLASLAYTGLLRALFDYRGTDTHGLKAFRRTALAHVAASCVVDRDVFASELVLRAERSGARIVEVPVRLAEKRPPSIALVRRVPGVISRLVRLRRALAK